MKSPYEEALQTIMYANSCAMRLKLQLENPMDKINDESVSNNDLAQSIINGFSTAISILSDKPKSEDDQSSDLSSRDYSSSLPSRSHFKKRKIHSTNSPAIANWRDDSPDPYYDGFLWRKYGQKTIKNSNHQRSYYRCSYNLDRNCGARKHEQKIKESPPVYRTTYFGHHSCKTNHNHNEVLIANVQDPVINLKSTTMIHFGKDHDTDKESRLGGFSFSVKQEEETIKTETMDQCRRQITRGDQDCQHVLDENLSSSGSYPDSECIKFDSDLLLDIVDSWDRYDLFDLWR